MKILCICQYYAPEPFRLNDICEELVRRGHEVTVVTGVPNYPMGRIYSGYRCGKKRREVIGGVLVRRCFTIGRRTGAFFRFLNYYSYAISSSIYVSRLRGDYDLVFVNQLSPVMMAAAGIRYKKKYGTKLALYCLDLWPESLVAGGIRRGSLLYRCFHRISERIYKQADQIFMTSKSFAAYFRDEFGITDTVYLPQYAETVFTPEECKKKPDGMIDLMFAGNIGAVQSVDTIIRAAALSKEMKNVRWHIVGDGSELDRCKQLARDFSADTVIFHGRKSLAEMPGYYSMADAMLVTMQKDSALSMTLPGKVQTYMAAGKPIIGAADGETAAVIKAAGCGFCSAAGDAAGLLAAVEEFIAASRTTDFGGNAYRYNQERYSKEGFMATLQDALSV